MSSRPLPEVRNLFSPPPRPPILPVVTAQMLLDTYEVALLVSKIELPTAGHLGPMRHQRFQHRFASAPPKSLHIPPSRYTPYTVPDRTVRYRPVSSMAADDTSPPSRSSSSVPEEANLDNNVMEAPSMAVDEPGERSFSDKNDHENGKISKPPGEVGRPNSGGYNLEVALDWSAADYKNLLVSNIMPLILLIHHHSRHSFTRRLIRDAIRNSATNHNILAPSKPFALR